MVAHALIPAIMRPRQVDLCKFEAFLVYRVNSRTAKSTKKPYLAKQSGVGLVVQLWKRPSTAQKEGKVLTISSVGPQQAVK